METSALSRIFLPGRAPEDREDPLYVPQPFLNRRALEKELMGYVALGSPELLEQYLKTSKLWDSIVIGLLSREALTQAKYLCVAMTAMACREAIDAGLPEQLAFSLSDELIRQADRMQSPEQVGEHSLEVLRRYCRMVGEHRLSTLSGPVRQCCEYMMVRLRGNVSLRELSGVCHLSQHYISDLFRKELGMGAVQYFQDQKLRYARHLVLTTTMSITQIASSLSYPSASNFTQRFRRAYGQPPLEYRKMQNADCRQPLKTTFS